jgi:N-acetylmuramoyl-L-alanine amidase
MKRNLFYKILFLVLMLIALNINFSVVHAYSNKVNIFINNTYVSSDTAAYIKNSRTYAPIRFVSEELGAKSVFWNQNTKTATIVFDNITFKFKINSRTIYVNGNPVNIDVPVELNNSRTFVPIRFISEQMGYKIDWENSTKSVKLSNLTSKAVSHYSSEDLYWLSRIVHAEAEGEPYEGKLAVANVIINRKNSSDFPSTIKSVIFDDKYGVQFTPIKDGTIYNTPASESVQASESALLGNNNIGACLYFLNPDKATHNWIINNKQFYASINNHDFYA